MVMGEDVETIRIVDDDPALHERLSSFPRGNGSFKPGIPGGCLDQVIAVLSANCSVSMFEEIVGASKLLKTVLARIEKVAPTDSTVLITGETGTGKELMARATHKRSRRSANAFVSVNCAALAPSLISSELFGHEQGAFTGAEQRRLGRFKIADGDTIFLDEAGELLPDTQAALLRVLQEREFERVGGERPIHVDVRVIAATNRDLEDAVANGTFRQDLFYRLHVFPIEPPVLLKFAFSGDEAQWIRRLKQ